MNSGPIGSRRDREGAYEDGTECSETLAHKIRTPGNHPKERIQHSQQGESLNSRIIDLNVILIINFLCLFSCLCILCFVFVIYCFSFCIWLSLFNFSTSLPTTATGWKPSCSK